jgi:hypothetical protein
MNVKRIMLWGLGGGAAVAWIAAAATSVSTPTPVAARTTPRRAAASSEALASEVARLHERLRPTTEPSESRNLFRYADRLAPAAGATIAAPVEVTAPVVLPAATPHLKLVGIAEETGDAGPVRTAIISGDRGELYFAKEGESLSQYRVTRVLPDAVELVDPADSARDLRLVLP